MAITGHHFDLIGVTVGGSGPVQSMVHLELDSGVTALYGLNGAGKSRVLQLVRSALSGVAVASRPGLYADVHIRLHDPRASDPGGFIGSLRDSLHDAIDQQRSDLRRAFEQAADAGDPTLSAWDAFQDLDDRPVRDEVEDRLEHIVAASRVEDPRGGFGPITAAARAALMESVRAGLITLRATGVAESPSWDLYLPLSTTKPRSLGLLESAASNLRDIKNAAKMPDEETTGALAAALSVDHPLSVVRHGIAALGYLERPNRGPCSDRSMWPEWLQVPLLRLAQRFTSPPAAVLDGQSEVDVDAETLSALTLGLRGKDKDGRVMPPLVSAASGGDGFEIDVFVETGAQVMTEDAAAVLSEVLIDPPELRFSFMTPDDWLAGERPHWEYIEPGVSDWLEIGTLSDARLRWTVDAIRLAMSTEGLPVVLISDEPERGLHRLAERRLAGGLGAVARAKEVNVIVATHSPLLLNAAYVRPHFVGRDDQGHVSVRDVSVTLVGDLDKEHAASTMGLSAGDLSGLAKLAVVVEGLHDEWVFTDHLRRHLDAVPAGVYPMHGAKRLQSLADARLIFEGSDSPVLIVLDNLSMERVESVWNGAVAAFSRGDLQAARDAIEPLLKLRGEFGDEYLFLHQLALRAVDFGRMDRLHVHGLSLPDVICYLPVDYVLIAPSESWERIIGRWRDAAAAHGSAYATNIKKWLSAEKLLPEDPVSIDERVREASARALREGVAPHPDLVALGARISRLGSGRGTSAASRRTNT